MLLLGDSMTNVNSLRNNDVMLLQNVHNTQDSTIRVPAVSVQINGLGAVVQTLSSGLHSRHISLIQALSLWQGGLAVGIW